MLMVYVIGHDVGGIVNYVFAFGTLFCDFLLFISIQFGGG